MYKFFFSLAAVLGSGTAMYAEDSSKNSEINFNDPAFIERVTENMHFSSPTEFKDMDPAAQERAQNVILGGND